ncbi:MAG: 30S ribosomal protein S12 methylthiotransferase RimO [Bacteroidales bacterium]|jgi:ribosomal protein S12 methylthiotransferase|nr:30S ribosomal protein S12 methylthiotransferase RimO [Bacteroidales bacterium]MDD4383659.1 30S ribosomal protein S12 methylthiotransferase RimO [Bacteroidales bacterium]MDY0197259.1 30S ribosomal protein S12 methylthiotransferase RimO [Tenuifilaceae bacterium]
MREVKKINVVTLGCSKNLVDSEYLLKQLNAAGWSVQNDSNDLSARTVVINTCGFIADAKEESINTILSYSEAKRKGLIDRVYVMGCLSQRYKNDLQKEIPEVDGFFGVNQLQDILSELNVNFSTENANKRYITTPKHYAYLKISEGCNWGCSFCAIPLIRGKHVSKPINEIIEQAKELVKDGVKELILIGQDSTFYGKDLYGERRITQLVREISRIEGLSWVRIHYAYPAQFPEDLLVEMALNPKICKYIDIPFQHISTNVLKEMKRGISRNETLDLIAKIRKLVSDVAIRTTLLVGHPGETESDFEELVEFVKEVKFDRLGVFSYSEEEGTASAKLDDAITEAEKQSRVDRVMETQRGISLAKNNERIGKVYEVIIDRFEGDWAIGRTQFDSPEVDQEVLIDIIENTEIVEGEIITCKIVRAEEYDLYGEVV